MTNTDRGFIVGIVMACMFLVWPERLSIVEIRQAIELCKNNEGVQYLDVDFPMAGEVYCINGAEFELDVPEPKPINELPMD